MPSVIVKLIYTPRPEGDLEFVALGDDPEGLAVYLHNDRVWIEGDDLTMGIASFDPAEALDLARAMVLVAGCADTRWRGWHWRAEGEDGEELGRTPPGQWYADRDDCLKGISALFGYDVNVTLCNGCHGLNRAAAIAATIIRNDRKG